MDGYLFLLLLIYTCAGPAFSMYMTIDISPPYSVVAPSTMVQLHCVVNTTSQSLITYKWFTVSNGEISPDNNKFNLLESGTTLEINNFNQQDQGQYYCIASNELGSIKSLQAELQIAFINNIVGQTLQTNKFFQLNQYLVLTCDVPQSVPAAEVSWYKGPSLISSSNPIGFTLNNSIVFSYCSSNEVGPWECRVKNSLAGGQVQTPNSYLLDSINPSLSTSQTAQIITGPVGQTVVAGESFELQCIAIGRPIPEYTWLKNGVTIDQDNGRIIIDQNSRILKITNSELSDAGSYTCQVDQATFSTTVLSEPALIVVNDPPRILSPIIESTVSQSQYASLHVSLSCKATGTYPISWSWFNNTNAIEESDNIIIEDTISNNVTESILTIQSLNPSDGGVWQCIASNDVTGVDQTTQLLTVNTTSPVISQRPTSDILAFVGATVTLPLICEAYPYPKFNWIKSGEALSLVQRHSIDDTSPFNGTLTIAPTITGDTGVYRGGCSNTEGNLNFDGIIVTVIDKPAVLVAPVDTLVSLDSSVMIHCSIDTDSQLTVVYIWRREFVNVILSDRIVAYPNGSLLVKDFNTDDIGYYECIAMIDILSSDADPLLYEIGGAFITEEPPSSPSPPTNLELGTITSRSVLINWDKPLNNGGLQILDYTIEVINHGRHDCIFSQGPNITINASVTQFKVTLHPYSQYSVAVYAINSMGNSNATQGSDVFWTLEEEPSIAPVIISSLQGNNVGELVTVWDHPPCQERNGRILNYIIRLKGAIESNVTTPNNVTSQTIGQLRALQDYTVEIAAVTSIGIGPFSLPIMAKTVLASAPDIPRNLITSQLTSTSVHISWDLPEPRENEPLNDLTVTTHYIVRYLSTELNVTDTNYTAVGLLAGTTVQFSIAAVNSFGIGEESLSMILTLPTELPSLVPSPTVTNSTDEIAFYQEVWFPGFAGGIAGGILLAVILICLLICVVSYCCRKNDKRNRSFSSDHTSGSVHSFTYPHRKSTVLDKMMQVESMESPVPDTNIGIGLETTDHDSGNGQDSGSVYTMSLSQSSSTLRSKYQYRSPMEQEEYQRLSDFRRSTKSDIIRTKVKKDTNNSKKLSTFKSAPNTPSNPRFLNLTRETSPTDTVSSFEYQSQFSQSQIMPQMRNKRLPSYTTDGYDTSSEDDSVFHSVHVHHTKQKQHHHHGHGHDTTGGHQLVTRNGSFKVTVDSNRPPNLALMTALPQNNVPPPYMPTAIPLTPQPTDPLQPTPLSTKLPEINHNQKFSRLPRLQPATDNRQNHVNRIDLRNQTSTFV